MALPTDADIVAVRGYWWDESTGKGVRGLHGAAATITFDPVAVTPAANGGTPNVRDLPSTGHIKLRRQTATVDPATGYFAVLLVASNDPDLDAYGGRRVTFPGEDPFLIEVPYNAPAVTVDAPLASATGLAQGSTIKAMWLTDAALLGEPTPAPPTSYLTSAQTLSLLSTAIETHDDDPDAHHEGMVTLADAPTIATDASLGRLFTVTLGGNRTLGAPSNLVDGMRLMWRVVQDATGGRTLTLSSVFNVNATVTGPLTFSTGPNQVDYLGGIYRQTAGKIDVLAFGRGF